jgi:hypothetical protein
MQSHRNKITLLQALVAIFIAISSYQFGVYSYQINLWPFDLPPDPVLPRKIVTATPVAVHPDINHDEFGRLTSYPEKKEINCPKQNKDTAVILAFGQSNSANSGEKKFSTQHAEKVINYFNGKCYIASSPLLGADGNGGEFITPLADRLIEDGVYKSVIIISSGIGGTPISRWQRDGDLNEMLLTTIRNIRGRYRITEVIWHQGENDFANHTSAKNYVKSFNSLLKTLSENKVKAPVFIAIATKCGPVTTWNKDNPTAMGQRQLIDNKKVFLGVDTDTDLTKIDRRSDECHFSESGQLKTAISFANAIRKSR